jgi:cysteinyl-tRNA synthetase
MQIYNTMTGQKEEFKPLTPGQVKMYVCGVTVYDYCHLGHARALLTFDMVYRYLQYRGFEVNFVRNFTDIDDKIIQRAAEQNIDWRELTQKFIVAFHEDTAALKMRPPTHEPRATEYIEGMLKLVKTLEDRGLAYKAGDDVYYAVRRFKGYGKLSGKNIDELLAGARVDVFEAKIDPLDFALWKGAKPGEPHWTSPWGEGRPGWHLECSVMSMHHLGESFDIHGGGRDLIFPHHENEIAQSEGVTQKPFARYWIHNGFVNINTEKMSKSLGNFLTIRDILKNYPAEVIRLFVLSAHYRSPLDYTEQNISNADSGLVRFYQSKKRLEDCLSKLPAGQKDSDAGLFGRVQNMKKEFVAAMDDDFNTARVVGSVFELVRDFNKALDEKKMFSRECLETFFETLRDLDAVLSLFGQSSEDFFAERNHKGLVRLGLTEQEITQAIADRKAARAQKDFKLADQIRNDLVAKGIEFKDNLDGTTGWSVR